MDAQLFESLLFQHESETLDFKSAQYPFSKDSEKAELLKDILAFANSWRQSDAHILIGVREVPGARGVVCGIDADYQFRDSNLQQFVSAKTNRPVSFSYQPFPFDGVETGVLTIPLQPRPTYLLSPYGGLKANVVYIRRGSSTAEASPDEIARMAINPGTPHGQPILDLEFTDIDTRERFGTPLIIQNALLELPDENSIPLYGKEPERLMGHAYSLHALENRNYYRDVAQHLRLKAFAHPIGLSVTNPSTTVAENVIVNLKSAVGDYFAIFDSADLSHFPSPSPIEASSTFTPRSDRPTYVKRFGDTWEVKAHFGIVQPGTTSWSDEPFYIGAIIPTHVSLAATISANNLRIPITRMLDIQIDPVKSKLEIPEIIKRARARQ